MKARPVIISGHQRSGTTLLQRVCDLHPDLHITSEAGLFFGAGSSYSVYRRDLYQRFLRARNRSIFSPKDRWGGQGYDVVEPTDSTGKRIGASLQRGVRLHELQNLRFLVRYLRAMKRQADQIITPLTIARSMNDLYPQAAGLGDKHPDYIFQLKHLTEFPDLFSLIIIRDPRDMANSMLTAYERWGKSWGPEVSDVKKIAKRWVKIIQLVGEQTQNPNVLVIRYEDLVHTPIPIITEISNRLDVSFSGFNVNLIHAKRIGAYRTELDKQKVAEVQEIAGPVMEQIGYSL